jgi:hypothetical protein
MLTMFSVALSVYVGILAVSQLIGRVGKKA